MKAAYTAFQVNMAASPTLSARHQAIKRPAGRFFVAPAVSLTRIPRSFFPNQAALLARSADHYLSIFAPGAQC
ncbi:MAG: hypothetical protein JNK71_00165 [Methyloversatilis sp.]|nr:hypothetical protein [Methyloversatilis sp.]